MTEDEARGYLVMRGLRHAELPRPLTTAMWQLARQQRRAMQDQQPAQAQDADRTRLLAAIEEALAYPEGAPAFPETFGERLGDALREGGQTLTRNDILDLMQQGGLLDAAEIARRDPGGLRAIIREAMLQTLAMPGVETVAGLPAGQLEQQTREILDRATNAMRPILQANARDLRAAERRERGGQANA